MRKKNKKVIIGAIVGLLTVGGASAAGFGLYSHFHGPAAYVSDEPENMITTGAFPGMSKSVVQNKVDKAQEGNMVTLNILNKIEWPTKDSYTDVGIYNNLESGYLLQVTITTENDEVVYKSPMLEPDQRIESAKITNTDIKEGEYTCNAQFEFFTLDGENLVTTQNIGNISVVVGKKA